MTAMSVGNANQFIGSTISLVSSSEIRYEGILYALNLREATISLAKVRSFGTEDRPTERPIPMKDEIYEFIIFRGADIKGIDVLEPPKSNGNLACGLPSDPAIIEVSHFHSSTAGTGHNCNSLNHSMRYGSSNNREGVFDGLLRGNRSSQGSRRSGPTSETGIQVDRNNRNNGGRNNYNNRNMDGRSRNDNFRNGPGRNDARGSRGQSPNRNQNRSRGNSGNRGQDRGQDRGQPQQNRQRGIIEPQMPPKVTFEDPFDFEKSNEELRNAMEKLNTKEEEAKKDAESKDETESKKAEDPMIYYDKDKFFDNISCEALERSKGKVARVDWRSERKMNAETFGLPWNPNQRMDNGQRNNFNYRPRGGNGNYRGGYRGDDNQMRYNNYRYNNRNSYGNNYGNNYGYRGQQQRT